LPIHYAVVKNHYKVLRHLQINKYGGINILDDKYMCNNHKLLSLAIQNGSYECIKLLSEFGADCLEKDSQGFTYLHMAAMSGHVNIFLFFLSKQVDINCKNYKNKTALDIAH